MDDLRLCISNVYIPYIWYIHTHRFMCPLVVQSYTTQCEAVNPIALGKYTILSGNFVFNLYYFDLRSIFQEHNPGMNQT